MTIAEYVKRMPFLADWDAETREGLAAALDELNGIAIESTDLRGQVGIISVRPNDHAVHIVRKEPFLLWARAIGVPQMHIDAIELDPSPGTLDVFVLAGPYELVMGVPVQVHLQSLGSGGN